MVVLITGASGGLGTAVVKTFLDSGASSVIGVDRSWSKHPTEDGRFQAIAVDLLDPAECARLAERVNPVDALIHVVGGFAGGRPIAETSDGEWRKMLDLNLNTAFYMFRAILPQMLEHNRGRIIAIGSRAGVQPMADYASYSVSKAALIALVKTLALETKDTGVTANVVLPSTIDTPANRAAMPDADYSKWVTPDSIAQLLVWLASGKAADINGAVIPMYGKS
jgi:NAD(P)-dependent dehydrogenase (short-subunit alcohol dehydrogenase family)